jgi:sugar O-acyltransferase (sialic acid O-acetyltransferase NeuD family)
MNKRIYIVGAQSTYITEAVEICEGAGYTDIVCVDNMQICKEKTIAGYPVIPLSDVQYRDGDGFICSVHTPIFREKIISDVSAYGIPAVSVIHPTAVVSKRARLSVRGVVIAAGVIVGSNTVIGDYVTINRGALIGHDITVESNTTIEAGVSVGGFCRIGEKSYLGMNASILPTRAIGRSCVVGAGSLVREDVPDNTFVAGVPAVVKKEHILGYQGTGNPIK